MMFREIHETKEEERNLNKDNYKKIKPENYGFTMEETERFWNDVFKDIWSKEG